MKKAICAALCLASLTAGAAAYQVPYTNGCFHVIVQQFNNNNPEAQAEMLKKLGLFQGTDKGFELERSMTRAEAAAMLCRFLGGETEAASGGFSHPFADVPAWASNAVGWLYQNKLTYGVSGTRYGSSQPVTADQFARFLSRALAGNDDFRGRMLTEGEAESFVGHGFEFERQDAVAMSVRALEQTAGPDTPTLAQLLIDKGVFTAGQFTDAAWDVIAPVYQDAKGTMAGVVFADRSEDGFLNADVTSGADCSLPYLCATREEGGQTVYYRLDCKTLAETPLGTLGAANTSLRYFTTLGGVDYFWESLPQPDHTAKERLIGMKGDSVSVVLDEEAAEGAAYSADAADEQAIPIRTLNGGYLLNASGLHKEDAANKETVWASDALKVTQEVTSAGTTIELVSLTTGESLQRYTVPQDRADDPRRLTEVNTSTTETILYGEAGLYGVIEVTLDASGQRGYVLFQYTDEPVLSYASADRLANSLYAVSHDPGERVSGHAAMAGTKIIEIPFNSYNFTDFSKVVRKPAGVLLDKSLGIKPLRIKPKQDFTYFEITNMANVGMGWHGYTYRYSEFDHRLTVTDYTHTYAQELPEWVESDPEGYKKAYIEREQARLDAIQGAPT